MEIDPYVQARRAEIDLALDSFLPPADTPPTTLHRAMRHSERDASPAAAACSP